MRALQGYGCSYCSGKRVLNGFNDLVTTDPEIAAQAYGWNPTLYSRGHAKAKEWICELGHIYSDSINHRTNMNTGCPFCAGKKALKGFNDLATTNPNLASEADGWDPTTITRGSNIKVLWKCPNGHTWKTAPTNRSRGEGCPSCSKSGFDPNRNGWLYLVYHEGWDLIQVGLTNSPENRLTDHRRTGFDKVLDLRGPMDGVLAQDLERRCLHALKKRGANFSNRSGVKKFDGYSEAWTKDSLDITGFKQLLDWVYEDESNTSD
jgi:predicted GIY-YIG superfamily endonuclease